MIWIIIIATLIAAVSFYDFSWSNATNNIRNEVVFENRHKTYGAYALRVEYGKQVIISFVAVALLFGGLVFASKFIGGSKSISITDNEMYIDVDLAKLKEKEEPKEEVYKVPVKTQPLPKFDLFKLINPTAKNDPVEDSVLIDMNKTAGNVDAKGDTLNGKDKLVFDPLPFDDGKCKDCPEDKTYGDTDVEELPTFSGLAKYLQKNVKYPYDAREIGIEGKVFVEFTVMKDGSVTDVKIKNKLYQSLEKEALRVIKNMPATWEPGKINGHKVNVRVKQPISFILNKK
ncbi:MAG: energy transducer TonB [Flavobacteriales bacterium]